jgi:CRISPR/Cas system endoribonuclease Cas6 (RAMP superfamily)
MVKVLERHKLPKHTQEETDNPIVLYLLNKKTPCSDGFAYELQEFMKAITPILRKLFIKFGNQKIVHNSFCEVSITLIPKPDKDNSRKKATGQYYS